MKRKWLIKIGAPVLALSLISACGNDDNEDPIGDETPQNQNNQQDLNKGDYEPSKGDRDTNNLDDGEDDDGTIDDEDLNRNDHLEENDLNNNGNVDFDRGRKNR